MKLKDGIEYEIVCAWEREGELMHKREIAEDDDNVFFLYHTGFTGVSLEESPGYRLLEYRANNIVNHIKESPYFAQGNYEQSFIDAFERMDKELEELVKEFGWSGIPLSAEYLWKTRYNTLVVLLHKKKELHVAGASHLHVLVIRNRESITVTSQDHIHQSIILRRSQFAGPNPMKTGTSVEYVRYLEMRNKSVKEHPKLFYYNGVPLKGTENYLVAACDNLPDEVKGVLNFDGLPELLPYFEEERGLAFAVDYLHLWTQMDYEGLLLAMRLHNRKREHGDSSEDHEVRSSSDDSGA